MPGCDETRAGGGMTPEEKLYELFVEHVKPDTYDGDDIRHDLVGQTVQSLGLLDGWEPTWDENFPDYRLLSEYTGVPYFVINNIADAEAYDDEPEFQHDLPVNLERARKALGLP